MNRKSWESSLKLLLGDKRCALLLLIKQEQGLVVLICQVSGLYRVYHGARKLGPRHVAGLATWLINNNKVVLLVLASIKAALAQRVVCTRDATEAAVLNRRGFASTTRGTYTRELQREQAVDVEPKPRWIRLRSARMSLFASPPRTRPVMSSKEP